MLGAEALIRWQHPVLGKLEPSAFLPVAEQSGLIAPIGELMLDDALATAAGWVDSMAPDQAFTLNVNLSARQLHDPRLVEVVRSSLVRAGLEPGRTLTGAADTAAADACRAVPSPS